MGWQDAPIINPATSDTPPAASPDSGVASPGAGTPAWMSAPIVTPAAGSPAEEHHGKLEELGRQLGLTLRAAAVGGAQIPGLVTDAITGPINAGLDATLGKDNGFRFEALSHAVDNLLTQAGVPNPKNATERVVQAAAQGAAGATAGVGAAKAAGSIATGVGQVIADQFAAGPGLQATSGALGMGAQQEVKEKGGSEGAQIAAGVLGSLAPAMVPFGAAAGTKALIRGGEDGRQAMENRIAAFDSAGVDPTMAQAADTRGTRATESLLSKVPGGAGVIAEKAQQQADQLQASVQQVSDALAPGANAITAGEAISSGVQRFKQGFKDLQATLYRNLDQYLPGDTPIAVGNTEFALKALNEDIEGAPNLSKFFKNARMQGIDKALQADLEQASESSSLPYEAVKKLRTLVGNEIANNSLVADVPRSKWTALYGALSEDLGIAAKQAGPDAEQAWQWANVFTKTQLNRLEDLSSVVSRDAPEKVFSAAIAGTAEGDTLAKRIVSALPKEDRRELAAAVIQRLGRATPGQQNSLGDAFSSETFLTNLSKMSQPARQTIFGRTDVPGIMDRVQTLGAIAESRRAGSKVFSNPSGTSSGAAQIAGVVGPLAAMASGQYKTALGLVGTTAASYAGAKAMTSRQLVDRVAEPTFMRPGAQAAAVQAAGLPVQQAMFNERQRIMAQRRPQVTDILKAPSVNDAILLAHEVANSTKPIAPAATAPSALPPIPAVPVRAPAVVRSFAQPAALPRTAPARSGPPVVVPAPTGKQPQPDMIWVGRRGDGYLTIGDAAMALPSRQKAQPDFNWRIESLPGGKFRLGGYAR